MAYDKSTSERRKPSHNDVLSKLYEFSESKNIAEDLDEEELTRIGLRVCEEFTIDERSREKWETDAKKAMDIALQVAQTKNYPWANASNVKWPLITVAALQFNARAYPEICNADGPVKAKVVGSDEGIPVIDPSTGQPAVNPETGEPAWKVQPGAKAEKAERISEHMSYQLTEEQPEWEDDVDTLLMQIPIVGCAFKKVYRDVGTKRNCSEMIPAMDLVVNQKVRSLDKAPRITHRLRLYPHEVEERQRDKLWCDIDLQPDSEGEGDDDAPMTFLEQHRRLDLDHDEYGEPYIVTVHKESQRVVRIVANYERKDVRDNGKEILQITPAGYFVKFPFIPDPDGGFYDIGFGRLLSSIGAAIDTTINQMLDAGHLQNAGGGFIGSGVRLKKAVLRMEPGVYHQVNTPGDNLRNAIVNMEHPGPSPVLFQLLGMMDAAGKDITAVKDILTGDTGDTAQTATTTLALIEQGMKVFTAIYKRIYRALKKEFKLLYQLNAKYLDDQTYFNVLDSTKAIARSDYSDTDYDVCPVADPRLVTDMQRLKRAELVIAFKDDPYVDGMEARKRFFQAAGIDDLDKLLKQPQPDPVAQATVEAELANSEADTEAKKATAADKQASAIGKMQQTKRADSEHEIDLAATVAGLAPGAQQQQKEAA